MRYSNIGVSQSTGEHCGDQFAEAEISQHKLRNLEEDAAAYEDQANRALEESMSMASMSMSFMVL